MNHVFAEYFRCPEPLPDFETAGDPSAAAGYFTFGDAICYGQLRGGTASPRAVWTGSRKISAGVGEMDRPAP